MADDSKGGRRRLRSAAWFDAPGREGILHRSWLKNQGVPDDVFDGRPVIGICNTWSELTPCNGHLRALAERVKRGVWEAGGFPLEFPVMSLGESLMRPSTMLFRNLASMDVEESIRANPIDGVILLGGCDKTTPALLMGAASCDLPAIFVSGGPMLNGKWRGRDVGSGTMLWKLGDQLKTGEITLADARDAEACMARSAGSCMTMGTASTMAALCEAMGVALPGNAAIPAPDARRSTLAHLAGRRIVGLVKDDVRLSHILTRAAFENAIVTNAGLGGSTNAVVHLLAIAGRLGVPLSLDDWDRLGRDVPCLANLVPSGKHLMEDFFYAGGLAALLRELAPRLHGGALTVTGRTLGEEIADAPCWNRDVIFTADAPFKPRGGIAVLMGNLAPGGALIKPSAATPALMKHRGPAVVFADIDDYDRRIDDPALEVGPESVLVLKNCGPRGYPGFPEVGLLSLPKKLLARGVTDMVRLSDARMSGTAAGTVVVQVAPESAAGGPLALVETGDVIELDVEARRLHLDVADDELARRRARWTPPAPHEPRGYLKLYLDHVQQADRGADLDFLVGGSGARVFRGNH
ncbi:MAG TPA: IlvD/Edd family dehydratase [Polyangia bacterium]|nr:IlvD/Edd family dehydratase [Polyangia bacterium]